MKHQVNAIICTVMALSTALSLQMPLTALASTGQNQSEGLEAHAGISSSDESSTTEIAVYPKEPLPYSLGEVKTIQMPANEFVIREAYRLDLDHGSTLTIKASGWNHHDSYSALALFSAADYDSFNKSAEVPFEKAIFVQNRTADDVSYSLPLSKGQYVLLFASGNGSGDAGSVQLTMTAKYKIMHRLYNSYTGEHFYTASASERDGLVAAGWTYEGVGWAAPDASGTPVYRLYNPYAPGGDHHYTMSASERDSLVEAGWRYEGVGWFSDDSRGVALYRQCNPYAATGSHNYTASKAENDSLVAAGWRAEGVAWYGVKR